MANVYSNVITVSESPGSGGGVGSQKLSIYDYNVAYYCYSPGTVTVSGSVANSYGPVQNANVYIGLCSQFNLNTNQFTGAYITTQTAYDGTFLTELNTDAPPGSSVCVVAMVNYNNQTAVAQQSIIIPQCCEVGETPIFNITATVMEGEGSVSPKSATLKPGQWVTFTAYPAYQSGYVFSGWILYLGGYTKAYSDNPLTLTYDDVLAVLGSSANKTCDVTLFAEFGPFRLRPIISSIEMR